jgi:hypothetical protein
MALRFLGKDPDSPDGDSPTVWEDGDDYILQGFVITEPAVLDQVGNLPKGETVIRFPKRMMQFFPEVAGASRTDA